MTAPARKRMQQWYANGLEYRSLPALCRAHQLSYPAVYTRSRPGHPFVYEKIRISPFPPELPQKDTKIAIMLGLVERPRPKHVPRVLVAGKPAPLLSKAHITHGVNDSFEWIR